MSELATISKHIVALDPRVIQGFLTFLSTLIGTGVALYIARNIYPKQKEIDRIFLINSERRKLYVEYLSVFNKYFSKLNQGLIDERLNDEFYEWRHFHEAIRVYGSSRVIAEVNNLQKLTHDLHSDLVQNHGLRETNYDAWERNISSSREKVKQGRFTLVSAMREEVLGNKATWHEEHSDIEPQS